MADFTAYGKAIKYRLIDLGMSQNQLIEQIRERSGLYCDCSLLGKILTGKADRPRIKATINEILGIEQD